MCPLTSIEHLFDTGAMAIRQEALEQQAVDGVAGLRGMPRHTALQELMGRARPIVPAGEQLLPVLPVLAGVLPWAGLRRGATVAVAGRGATSVALALLAAASAAGSWCAVVGMPSIGVVAASELGVELGRLALVAVPGAEWAAVSAALLDAFDIVLLRPPERPRAVEVRRLAARARERGAVLLVAGAWDGADLRLTVARSGWDGLGRGHGLLRRRRLDVVADGRGAAARQRRGRLWLPAAEDRPTTVVTGPPPARRMRPRTA
jgi:hypothetical protein